GGDLVAAQLAPEADVGAEASAEVNLEPLRLRAVGGGDQLALQADVRHLETGAAVRAAVHADGDRLGGVRAPPLPFIDHARGGDLGLDDGELAELDAGAGDGVPAERAGPGRQPDGVESVAQ